MRVQRFVGSKIASALAVGLCFLSSTGCARRFKLTPDELTALDKRVVDYERRAALDPQAKKEEVFVYTHRRFIAKYERSTERAHEMGRTVKVALEEERKLVLVRRSSPGQIIAREESNGVPLLWVSFDIKCNTKDCAFGFVRAEDNRHKLAYVPPREDFKFQALYWRNERPRDIMKKKKIKGVGEANFVYVLKRWHRVKTVYLDVKKRIKTDENRTFEVQAVPVNDRPGAGDAFVAGVLHGHLNGSVLQGIGYGLQSSKFALTHHGDLTRISAAELEIPASTDILR